MTERLGEVSPSRPGSPPPALARYEWGWPRLGVHQACDHLFIVVTLSLSMLTCGVAADSAVPQRLRADPVSLCPPCAARVLL